MTTITLPTVAGAAPDDVTGALLRAVAQRFRGADPRRDLALFLARELGRRVSRSKNARVAALTLGWPALDHVLALADVRWSDGGCGGRYWVLAQADATTRLLARREGDERRAFQALELDRDDVPFIRDGLDRVECVPSAASA